MKSTCFLIPSGLVSAGLALLTLFPLAVRADTAPPLTAAVLDFQTSDDLKEKGSEIAALLDAQISTTAPDIILVERQELEKVLGEQELGASGTVDPDTAAKLGYLTGAKVLITGRLFAAGDKYYIIGKIISTETGRVYGESATFSDPNTLDKGVADLAAKVVNDMKTHGDTLVAKVEDPSARLERLKKVVAGKKLPTVSVQIGEQNLDAQVVDPAAETAIKLMLQQLGFTILDPQDQNKTADLAITGQSFSEPAMRRGNLVSCRARVEIKVASQPAGVLLLADRQTGVGIDIAENNAGKTAIEDAANRLLDRIVPALVKGQ
jgi:hypothetical protein